MGTKNGANLDLSVLVEEPPFPFDYILTNGSCAFETHAGALRKLSSVFRDILDGDNDHTELKVDLSDGNLSWVNDFPKMIGFNMSSMNKSMNLQQVGA